MNKRENCWNPLRASSTTAWPVTAGAKVKNDGDWAISSRASEESVEGSTTNAYGPTNNSGAMKRHDYPPRKGRYSLLSRESREKRSIKGCAITGSPFTQKLDNLSQHPVTEIINKVLKYDAAKAFDIAAHAQFNLTPLTVQPTGGTSTTDAVTVATNSTWANQVVATAGMGSYHIRGIVTAMKERNIPGYTGDDYYCIAWPSTMNMLKEDLEAIHIYTPEGFRMIANGEMGRYNQCRFVEQTNIAKSSWTYTDWAFFFGADTVAEAIAVPEEMRGGFCPALQ